MKIILSEVSQGKQSLSFQEIRESEGMKVKVNIKSDTYDFQSFANLYVWSKESLQWNHVVDIPYSNMKTEIGLASSVINKNIQSFSGKFQEDANQLLKLAGDILDVSLVDFKATNQKRLKV